MLTATLPLLVALGFARPVGTELWRVEFESSLLAVPAVSAEGAIALLTPEGVRIIDAGGVTLGRVEDVQVPFQPFWQGERVWVRTETAWRPWKDGELGAGCVVNAQSGAVDDEGRVWFAPPQELVACEESGARVVAKRRGQSAQVFTHPGGLVTGDDWFLESFDRQFQPLGARVTSQVGYPAAVTASGTILVTNPGGRIDALDLRGNVLWKGPAASDGAPVLTRSGAIVVLGDRAASVVDPPFTIWSLPVPAGARAALALDDGSIALLDRLGRVGVARDGKLVWSKTLRDPGNVLVPFANGILVQDGAAVVAYASPSIDRGSPLAASGGLARDNRSTLPTDRRRCPVAPRPPMKGKRLHLDGPAFFDGDRCVYPSAERDCREDYCAEAGRVAWRFACPAGCGAALTPDGGLVRGDGDKLIQTNPKGKGAHPLLVKLEPGFALAANGNWVAVRTKRDLSWVDFKGRTKRRLPMEKPWSEALAMQGDAVVGVEGDELVTVPFAGDPVRAKVGAGDAMGALELFPFGPMTCVRGGGVAGCLLDGKPAQGLSLEPRTAWWGEAVVKCGADALCHRSAGAPDEPFFKADGDIDQFTRAGDLLAVLVAGREVVAVAPIGDVRWRVPLAQKGECAATRWLQKTAKGLLVARGCGEVVAINPG